jgi:hypothetical protein
MIIYVEIEICINITEKYRYIYLGMLGNMGYIGLSESVGCEMSNNHSTKITK